MNEENTKVITSNQSTEILILIVYAIIEFIGIVGNVYVILWSICSSTRTLTKHLLGNVAMAHLLYLITVVPMRNWLLFKSTVLPLTNLQLSLFDLKPCDLIAPLETFCTSVTVLSFYAIGIERFNSASRLNKPYTQVPSCILGRLLVIWLSSTLLALPDALLVDTKIKSSPRCPANYYANSYFNSIHSNIFTFAQLYVKSRLFWLMTFLFLLPLIYTVLGSVIVAIKTARSSKYTDKIKARDERRMNALVVAVLVGFLLCWAPHYVLQLIVTYGDKGGTTILGPFCLVLSDMQYYFISFGACINPILLALAAPSFWCKWSRSSEKPVENEQDTIIHSLLGSEEKI